MPETTTITVRISAELRGELDRLAKLTERSRSYLAAEAIDAYVRNELEIIDGLLEATADFDAGKFYTHDEMIAYSDEIITRNSKRRRLAKATSKPTGRKAAA